MTNTKQQIEDYKARLEALSSSMNNLKKRLKNAMDDLKQLQEEERRVFDQNWWPEKGERYYRISDSGGVTSLQFACYELYKVHSRYSVCGLFQHKEHAETYLKINRRYHELMEMVGKASFDEWFELYYNEKSGFVSFHKVSSGTRRPGCRKIDESSLKTLLTEFTQDELKIWVLGGAVR